MKYPAFLWIALVVAGVRAEAQRPVIQPGGIVNAASYVMGGWSGKAVGGQSIVSVFGTNLAPRTQSASGFPLPPTLAGVTVTFNGSPAPLLYVSPGQINFQLGEFDGTVPLALLPSVVVTTPAGSSDPYPLDIQECFGILTLDGSGCGQGVVLNVASDGSLSLNSPSNSASPGDYIAIFGTGLGNASNMPAPGVSTPLSPLSVSVWQHSTGVDFDLQETSVGTPVSFAGKTPGWIGIDQVNVQIPLSVREGCAVPIRVFIYQQTAYSRAIPISIHKGGGQCVDPPVAGYGQITWQKTVATGVGAASGVTETVTASFPASPGKQAPVPDRAIQEGTCFANITHTSSSLSCPLPGYRSLDVGTLIVQGPGLGATQAVPTLADGQLVYQAMLPTGTIQPGSFQSTASGGTDVDAFTSTTPIGAGIDLTTSFPPGTNISTQQPITISWTGGDSRSLVTLKAARVTSAYTQYNVCTARASAGTLTMGLAGRFLGVQPGPGEITIEVVPDPAQVPGFSAPGLSLGGQHLWKYSYRFGSITFQ